MSNFQQKFLKLKDQVYFFIQMYGVKGKISRTIFKEIARFFGFGNPTRKTINDMRI